MLMTPVYCPYDLFVCQVMVIANSWTVCKEHASRRLFDGAFEREPKKEAPSPSLFCLNSPPFVISGAIRGEATYEMD